MLLAPANRSSVTSRSWKVPAARSTRPLAWGERANIICIPSSSMARLNWVDVRREAGPWCVPEDPVPVDVEGDGNANPLQQVLDQQEIGVGLLLLTEQGVGHRADGIIDCDQQRERRNLVPQPRVVAAVHLDQHPLSGHSLAAYPVLGRTPALRGLLQTGVDQDAPAGWSGRCRCRRARSVTR